MMHEKTTETDTACRLWLCGPFPSPYNNAQNCDSMICVASGVGITPDIPPLENYRESRTCNLVWAVLDASMLAFFLENAKLYDKATNLIFYTGKDPLPDKIENYNISHDAHLEIVRSRATIGVLIPNIIDYFENPDGDYNKFELWRNSTDDIATTIDGSVAPDQGYRFSNASWIADSEFMEAGRSSGDHSNVINTNRNSLASTPSSNFFFRFEFEME